MGDNGVFAHVKKITISGSFSYELQELNNYLNSLFIENSSIENMKMFCGTQQTLLLIQTKKFKNSLC